MYEERIKLKSKIIHYKYLKNKKVHANKYSYMAMMNGCLTSTARFDAYSG